MGEMNCLLTILLILQSVAAVSPTNNYAPGSINCPGQKLTRPADSISSQESAYINGRQQVTSSNLADFLNNANMTDIDINQFLASVSKPITIGLAFSGGGYRAMLSGAGQLSALDARTQSLPSQGPLQGLLQASSYISGLSGGSWLVGSVAMSDFKSIDEILAEGTIWNIERSMLDPYGVDLIQDSVYYSTVSLQIDGKLLAGFPITITDLWSRFLSYQLLTEYSNDGAATTFDDIENLDSFANFQMPFPILGTVSRLPHTFEVNANSAIFELNPYEIGSWDPSISEFSLAKYIGTKVDGGIPTSSNCVAGFNNAGFFMGTSSSLFNSLTKNINFNALPPFLQQLMQTFFVNPVTDLTPDISRYEPNPFYTSSNNATSVIAKNESLFLVDGGEDGQNIPLYPLLQKERGVDIIFAHDNSADVNNYPDGTSLITTYETQFTQKGKYSPFPYVPGQDSFKNLNLTARPTFFGCNASNLTSLTDDIFDVPLVVYMPNRPYSYWSNTSTYKLSYADSEKRGMITNGFENESRKNGTLDSEWAACVGCAIIRREQERQGIEQTEQCQQCFQRYCWDGTIYSGPDLGDNYSDNGREVSAQDYNSQNTAGINDGGIAILKRDNLKGYPVSLTSNDISAIEAEISLKKLENLQKRI